jgi:hypothetical protein
MTEEIKLFGKNCNINLDRSNKYTLLELYNMAKKVKLITTRQNYNQLCAGLNDYFVKNGIENETELEKHISRVKTIISEPSTRQIGENNDLDILLNSNPDDFLKTVEYFQNLKKYSSHIIKIGTNSSNGFIRKLQYLANEELYSIILKGNQTANSDNLVYEYLVGQCINEYARFYPIFARTYMIGLFNDQITYSIFKEIIEDIRIDKPFDNYIKPLNINTIQKMTNIGCKSNQHLAIFTQNLPITETLDDFLKKISSKLPIFNYYIVEDKFNEQLYNLTIILHMIYQSLSSFAYMFTHYDLHLNNVGLIRVPDNKFIHIIYHYPDGRTVHYNTIYIPIIIDYGRCFINCQQLNRFKSNSKEIMKNVCSNDHTHKTRDKNCKNICGNESGYKFATNYDIKKDLFEHTSYLKYYIDYTRKNISHDCRLLNEICIRYDFNFLNENIYIAPKLKAFFSKLHRMDMRMGTQEIEFSSKSETIDNVIMASSKLTQIISEPKFNIVNNEYISSRTLYGTLQIWTDLSRPFEFN